MRKPLATILILPLLLLVPRGSSDAGIDNTHHDVTQHLPEKGSCLVCHSRRDANSYGTMEEDLGRVGGLCLFLCHTGKGILPETDTLVPRPGPSVNTADYSTESVPDYTSVFFSRSHGRRPRSLKDGKGKAVAWPPPRVSWQGVGDNVFIECTSCHEVHDNGNPPFLVAPLGASSAGLDGLCDRCHVERAIGNLADPPDGSHPVDFFVDNAAAAARAEAGRHPRLIAVQRYGREDGLGTTSVFDVPNPSASQLRETGVSWNMGGHLLSGADRPMEAWKGSGGKQAMGCYTCHSAHRPNVNGEKNLVVVKTIDEREGWNPLCVGCHGAATSPAGDREEWNVGTTAYGHPGGSRTSRNQEGQYTTTEGGFKFRVATPVYANPGAGNRFGPDGQLLCTSCHSVHFGKEGTMAVADMGQGTKSVCKACHSGVGHLLPPDKYDPPNSHHVTLTPEKMVERIQWGFTNPSWADTASGRGDLATGMDCADCHVYQTAHNWD